MTTKWTIAGMKRIESTGLVVNVTYIFNAEEDGIMDRKVGNLTFSGSPSEPGYIPYENLTESDVLGWVYTGLGSEKTNIENAVTGRVRQLVIQKQQNPYSQGMPWNNND
jgi:hypothetical protein